jgi:hypothetical protein
MFTTMKLFLVLACGVLIASGCSSSSEAQKNTAVSNGGSTAALATDARPQATPSNKFTSADVAKLRWIEGTWRGMDGDKPFYERYKIEENAMVVESLKEDGSLDGEPGRFELKDGEFGKTEGDRRSAASEIGADFVQFVPAVPGKGNNFRFTKQPHGWDALLEWPAAADKPARSKTYKMEPWEPKK